MYSLLNEEKKNEIAIAEKNYIRRYSIIETFHISHTRIQMLIQTAF